MKIKISGHIRKYIILYIALVLILYLVIEMVPKVTNIFETTQILEPGSLALTNEADGYLVKKESITISPQSGEISYLEAEGTLVRKNQKVISIRADEDQPGQVDIQYSGLLKRMKGYEGLAVTKRTPASGIFSLTMDGSEKALNPENLDKLTYETVQDLPLHGKDLTQTHVAAGDPIYKITNDNRWYVVCWLKKDVVENYYEGQSVKLQLPAGLVDATVQTIAKEKKRYKVVFRSDAYYKELAQTREAEFTIQSSEMTGLLIDNDCIVQKNKQDGVYVRDKNGDYYFVRVNVIETDGHESVISESTYIDAEGREVFTVSVYDEVLKNPDKELRRDLEEEKEAREEERQKEKNKEKLQITEATEATEATQATRDRQETQTSEAKQQTRDNEEIQETKTNKETTGGQ